MIYTLPDGRKIDLAKVESISKIRDYGRDPKTIDVHLIGFAIHLQRREVVEITDGYHFSDWAEVKKRLKALRADIVKHWEDAKGDDA